MRRLACALLGLVLLVAAGCVGGSVPAPSPAVAAHTPGSPSRNQVDGSSLSGRRWLLGAVITDGLRTPIPLDQAPTLELKSDGSSAISGLCYSRLGRWALTGGGLHLSGQRNVLMSCGAPSGPTLLQTFVFSMLNTLDGPASVDLADARLTVTTASIGLVFSLGGTNAVQPGATLSKVHWRLVGITDAGVTTPVPAAADEWLELGADGHGFAKFTACQTDTLRWQATTSSLLTQMFAASDWTCPTNGSPTVRMFRTDFAEPVTNVGASRLGSQLILSGPGQTLKFVADGPAKYRDPELDSGGTPWVPVPQSALSGVDPALIGERWILTAVAAPDGRTTTFGKEDSVDLQLYGDGSLQISDLCVTRDLSWRVAAGGIRLVPWRGDHHRCAATPPPEVRQVGWPTVSGLTGNVATTVSRNTLTIRLHLLRLTFVNAAS